MKCLNIGFFQRLSFVGLATAGLPLSALCQPVLVPAPVPPAPVPAASAPEGQGGEPSPSVSGPAAIPGQSRLSSPFQYGPVVFRPHASYSVEYDQGLQSQPGQSHNTWLQTVSPGAWTQLGRIWSLDYTPTLAFYSDPYFKDTLGHAVSLNGNTAYEDWTYAFAQSAMLSSDSNVQTARQTEQQNYATRLNAGCQLGSKDSLQLGVAQDFGFVSGTGLQNSRTWSGSSGCTHQWDPAFATGLSLGGGYSVTEASSGQAPGTEMSYEQLNGQILWRVVEKLNLSLGGGGEIRQFLDSSQDSLISPLLSASITYQPVKPTTLFVAASRSVNASLYQNQLIEATLISGGVNQQLLERLTLSLSGGYSHGNYLSTQAGSPDGRQDDHSFFRAGLSTRFFKRGSAMVYCAISQNASNANGYGYNTTQSGLQLSYAY